MWPRVVPRPSEVGERTGCAYSYSWCRFEPGAPKTRGHHAVLRGKGRNAVGRSDSLISDDKSLSRCERPLVGGGAYYKKKGVVQQVQHRFIAQVCMSETGHVLRVDQDDLETVVPKPGHRVRILNGPGRGEIAVLDKLLPEKCVASLVLPSDTHAAPSIGRDRARVIEVPYDDLAKHVE